MTNNIKYKEEIHAALNKLIEEEKQITWSNFVQESETLIIDQYDAAEDPKDYWESITTQLRSKRKQFKVNSKYESTSIPSSSSSTTPSESSSSKLTSSSKINKIVLNVEKDRIVKYLQSRKEEDKWKLKTNKIVEDEMVKLIEKSVYEHPVHSLILDPKDPVWERHFTKEELNEIKATNVKSLPVISSEMEDIFRIYEVEDKTSLQYYDIADKCEAHPINEFHKKWVKESIKSASELFFEDETLNVDGYSETDLFLSVWEFTYKLYKQKGIKANMGEKSSKAVSYGKNSGRSLEVVEKRQNKNMGSRLDILFTAGNTELATCEVGKHDVEEVDNKYLYDGLFKLPKTLRDMLSRQVQANPSKINQLATVGFLMMGLDMELIILDIPEGKHVSRVTRTAKFPFPTSIKTFSADFLSLLELNWKGREMLMKNLSVLYDKKRKAAVLLTEEEEDALIPSFYQQGA